MQLRSNQTGALNPLLIPLILSIVIVLGLAGFSVWSYNSYLHQKDDTDQIVNSAVDDARAAQKKQLEAQFVQREKRPLSTYTGPGSLGSVTVKYPKTWSAYVEDEESSSLPLDGYFHPGYVPAVKSETAFALRVEIENKSYADETKKLERDVIKGALKSSPIRISRVTGTRYDGEVEDDFQGAMVMFPLRDKTLRVWTRSTSFVDDFNNIILKNLTFIP